MTNTPTTQAYHRVGLSRLARRYGPIWPFVSWTVFGIGALYCLASIAGLTGYAVKPGDPVAGDAWNYWSGIPYESEHYRYAPAYYWVTLPLRALPFEVFVSLWAVAHLAAIAWLGPWTIVLAFDDVIRGNVTTFLAVAIVLAVRGQAWTWVAVLLTKVTPGVGLLYHVGRREWRAVVVAVATTLFVVVVTWPLGLWPEWFRSLGAAQGTYPTVDLVAPLPIRVLIGGVLSLAAARWLWLLPIGMIVAMPGLLPSSFALLAALPRLLNAASSASRTGIQKSGRASPCP